MLEKDVLVVVMIIVGGGGLEYDRLWKWGGIVWMKLALPRRTAVSGIQNIYVIRFIAIPAVYLCFSNLLDLN